VLGLGWHSERCVMMAKADIGFRCNNVLWIQGANQSNGADTKMEG
jgi:hypothetical protein